MKTNRTWANFCSYQRESGGKLGTSICYLGLSSNFKLATFLAAKTLNKVLIESSSLLSNFSFWMQLRFPGKISYYKTLTTKAEMKKMQSDIFDANHFWIFTFNRFIRIEKIAKVKLTVWNSCSWSGFPLFVSRLFVSANICFSADLNAVINGYRSRIFFCKIYLIQITFIFWQNQDTMSSFESGATKASKAVSTLLSPCKHRKKDKAWGQSYTT